VIVYSHGGAIEVALNILEGRDKEKDDFRSYFQENTAINEIIFQRGKWRIMKVNDFEHVKLVKPEKTIYENQDEIYSLVKETIEGKIPEQVAEAYLFGSLIKKQLGKYVVPFGRHKASNVDVLVVMNKIDIPLKWRYIKQEDLWIIYQGSKLELNGNKHRIDFFVVNKENKEKALEKLKTMGWNPERIK